MRAARVLAAVLALVCAGTHAGRHGVLGGTPVPSSVPWGPGIQPAAAAPAPARAAAAGGQAGDTADVRQLLTFEKEESFKYAGFKEEKDGQLVIRYNTYGSYHRMGRGDATEGEWAIVKPFDPFDPYAKGYTEGGLAAVQRTGRLLNGFNWMRQRGLTGDWSAYDRLWVDVKSSEAKAHVQVRVLDRWTVPVPARHFEVPAGAWVTLEFNLDEAADSARLSRVPVGEGQERYFRGLDSALYRARVLDLADVLAVFVNVVRVDAKSTLLLDHLRLVRRGAEVKPALPLLTDVSPWPVPEALPAATTPHDPRPQKGAPEVPLRTGGAPRPASSGRAVPTLIDLSSVRGISYGRLHNDRCGIAVADADRMAITLEVGMDRCVLVTADGGRTWTGLDGRPGPTGLFGSQMMVGATSTPGADGPNLLVVTLQHCSGGEEPSAVYFRQVRPTAQGWTPGPLSAVDIDSWHCPEHTMDVLRLPNGRLWAAWTPTVRSGGVAVTARYSDDDGATWRDLGENGHLGGKGRPLLVPWRGGVACFRLMGGQDFVDWSHTADGAWSKPVRVIDQANRVTGIATGAPVGERSLLLALTTRDGQGRLLRLDGDQWVDEPAPFTPTRLSVAGDRVIGLAIRDKRAIVMSIRGKDGAWGPVTDLATEEEDLMDLAAPTVAPDGFLPVIWAPRSHRWIKFLHVPR